MSAPRRTRAELDALSMGELVAAWHDGIGALVDDRHGIGPRRPGQELAGHALDALSIGEHLAGRLAAARWVTVVDALNGGATLAEVADALGFDVSEVRAGLSSWVFGQHRENLMTDSVRDAVLTLLDGAR